MVFEVTEAVFEHALKSTAEHLNSGPVVITKMQQETVSGVCIGLLSDVQFYRVEYTCDDSTYTKSLVVKIPFNKPCFEISRKRGYYRAEYIMYDKIIPELNQLLGTELTPRPYKCAEDLVIILDNLVHQGFSNVDKYRQLDQAQATAAVQLLAKFHAGCYKLNQSKPELFEFYKRKIEIGTYVVEQLSRGFDALLKFISEDEDLRPYLAYTKTAVDRIKADPTIICRYDDERPSTLNHGDYWINNILFRDLDGALHVRMIDFQTLRWLSPVFDIVKLIVCSVQFQVLENHSAELFKSYADQFNDTLKSLGSDYSYSIDQFYSDMRLQRFNYLVQIAIFLRALYASEDSVVADESNNDAINLKRMFVQERNAEVHYKKRLLKWLRYLQESDVFELNGKGEEDSSKLSS